MQRLFFLLDFAEEFLDGFYHPEGFSGYVTRRNEEEKLFLNVEVKCKNKSEWRGMSQMKQVQSFLMFVKMRLKKKFKQSNPGLELFCCKF